MKLNKAGLLMMGLILLTGLAKVAWADEDVFGNGGDIVGSKANDFIKNRSYFGVVGTSTDIDQFGDFTGTNGFTFPAATTVSGSGVTTTFNGEADLVPAITRKFGWGVLLGHREGPWAAEVSFWRSDHTATYYTSAPSTITAPASLQALNIDLKRYFFTNVPTQPFVSIGVSFPWLWIRNFSYIIDTNNNIVGQNDETISGIGLNLGAGLEIYLDNDFSILGGAYQRWAGFDQINGATKVPLNQLTFDNNPANVGSIAGNGLNLYVGTTFGFE